MWGSPGQAPTNKLLCPSSNKLGTRQFMGEARRDDGCFGRLVFVETYGLTSLQLINISTPNNHPSQKPSTKWIETATVETLHAEKRAALRSPARSSDGEARSASESPA